jgi:hypothetical protein
MEKKKKLEIAREIIKQTNKKKKKSDGLSEHLPTFLEPMCVRTAF